MTAKEIVQHACVDAHITLTALAEKMGMSRSQLNHRLNTGKFSVDEWAMMNALVGDNLVWKYFQVSMLQQSYTVEETI